MNRNVFDGFRNRPGKQLVCCTSSCSNCPGTTFLRCENARNLEFSAAIRRPPWARGWGRAAWPRRRSGRGPRDPRAAGPPPPPPSIRPTSTGARARLSFSEKCPPGPTKALCVGPGWRRRRRGPSLVRESLPFSGAIISRKSRTSACVRVRSTEVEPSARDLIDWESLGPSSAGGHVGVSSLVFNGAIAQLQNLSPRGIRPYIRSEPVRCDNVSSGKSRSQRRIRRGVR